MRNFRACCAAFLLVVGALATTWAPAHSPLPEQPPKGDSSELTLKAIGEMLDQLGYEYKELKDKKDQVFGHSVKIERGTWTFNVEVALSSNKQWLWLTGWLPQVKDVNQIPAPILLQMLDANSQMGPTRFEVLKETGYIRLTTPLYNRGITRVLLKSQIEGTCSTIERTEPMWNAKKWPGVKAPGGEKGPP